MNKRLKALTAVVIIIQLLIPTYLLVHHNEIRKYAEKNGEEYKFRLEYLFTYYAYDDLADESVLNVRYFIDGMSYNFGKTAAVNVGADGFAHVTRMNADKNKTDIWLSKKYYKNYITLSPSQYTFEASVDVSALQEELSDENKYIGNGKTAYITAKVYKGIFIPTAIYYKGEKILTIDADAQ